MFNQIFCSIDFHQKSSQYYKQKTRKKLFSGETIVALSPTIIYLFTDHSFIHSLILMSNISKSVSWITQKLSKQLSLRKSNAGKCHAMTSSKNCICASIPHCILKREFTMNRFRFLDKGQRADRIDCEGIKFVAAAAATSNSSFTVHRCVFVCVQKLDFQGIVHEGCARSFFIEKYFYSFLETREAHTKKKESNRSGCVLPDRCLFVSILFFSSWLFTTLYRKKTAFLGQNLKL